MMDDYSLFRSLHTGDVKHGDQIELACNSLFVAPSLRNPSLSILFPSSLLSFSSFGILMHVILHQVPTTQVTPPSLI
ncbi:hypothetical protein PAXRUDRAFT_350331 [Paxillus rubicundulus Ve08.2h10]|uniref:Unplaced genomic scaffold scaffold_194, whole genome shotgun sequence n=1 Tax=Paxillus rubicundulus Ve08.2h10 TaxID=930991 RepID=A0A0D0E9L4_9AGAM|nr:hypothetical protein PAXRUDRAFT_350331 [Paxillus rubicundulus Ve08.2h10]